MRQFGAAMEANAIPGILFFLNFFPLIQSSQIVALAIRACLRLSFTDNQLHTTATPVPKILGMEIPALDKNGFSLNKCLGSGPPGIFIDSGKRWSGNIHHFSRLLLG
jgi:hypothetical protein